MIKCFPSGSDLSNLKMHENVFEVSALSQNRCHICRVFSFFFSTVLHECNHWTMLVIIRVTSLPKYVPILKKLSFYWNSIIIVSN